MVRFMFLCMAVVALSLAAIPAVKMYDGISDMRSMTLAEAEQPATTETDTAEALAFESEAPSVDELNAIATAAGGFEGSIEDNSEIRGRFGGETPAGLAPSQENLQP